jgi:hypothetical protein
MDGADTDLGWIFLWHYNQFKLTLPVMIGLLITLIRRDGGAGRAHRRRRADRRAAAADTARAEAVDQSRLSCAVTVGLD